MRRLGTNLLRSDAAAGLLAQVCGRRRPTLRSWDQLAHRGALSKTPLRARTDGYCLGLIENDLL